ncbi:hypothetical protein GOQ30_16985 [Flavobacterium sp. TP390]|uniref:Lipoprotein n=1 Tax=Flavobacterium profundi TaxID=1774945 RepID=A0A6I4IV95_9FLAO|nr:hypothetical protein [Flavobacterium profundi]MVO10869.1 hypothetical protein [Flavobacterium profundi]
MRKICIVLVLFLFTACNRELYFRSDMYNNMYPVKKYVNEITSTYDLKDINIKFEDKIHFDVLQFYNLYQKRCPGFAQTCNRSITLYSESIPEYTFLNYKDYMSVYYLNEDQAYVIDNEGYEFFLEQYNQKADVKINLEAQYYILKSKCIDISKNIRQFNLKDVDVYIFSIDCDVFNYFFPNSAAIYPYSEDGRIKICLFQEFKS